MTQHMMTSNLQESQKLLFVRILNFFVKTEEQYDEIDTGLIIYRDSLSLSFVSGVTEM
jgi:hypothetical protein